LGARVAIAALGALTALCIPASAMASHGPTPGPKHDFAAGGGSNGFFQIGLSAQSGPEGENPRGYVSARSRPNGGFPVPFRFGGEVTCLRVDGNRASIKYRFDHADNPLIVGGGIQIFVEDNGEPEDGQTADQTAFEPPMPPPLFDASQPSVCSDPNLAAYTPGETGNLVVHDAS
jgi:hypothetical protein